MSIAAGIDFGDFTQIGLNPPSAMESIIIAKHRHYHNVIKIQPNGTAGRRSDFTKSKVRAHHILFRHDAGKVASLALLLQNFQGAQLGKEMAARLQQYVTVHLLGLHGALDPIAINARWNTTICARAFVVYQWLTVLKECPCEYCDYPELPDLKNSFKEAIPLFNREMFEAAEHIHDKDTVKRENSIGNDVAQVRTGVLDPLEASEIHKQELATDQTFRPLQDNGLVKLMHLM
jgi:hypothetical protein